MHVPAQQFLCLRAIGAPAVVVYLAIQGIFRGFKDTRTPVLCLGKFLLCLLRLSQNMTCCIYIFLTQTRIKASEQIIDFNDTLQDWEILRLY